MQSRRALATLLDSDGDNVGNWRSQRPRRVSVIDCMEVLLDPLRRIKDCAKVSDWHGPFYDHHCPADLMPPGTPFTLSHRNYNPLAPYADLQRLPHAEPCLLQPDPPQSNPRNRPQTCKVIAAAWNNRKEGTAGLESAHVRQSRSFSHSEFL